MGLFSIFWLGAQRGAFQSVFAFGSFELCRTPRFTLQAPRGCATRRQAEGEAWWARQDSTCNQTERVRTQSFLERLGSGS